MGLDELRIEIVIADADRFLARTKRRFDAILDDLFLSGPLDVARQLPPVGERLARLQDRLTPGGIVAANLITDGVGHHQTVRRQVRRAFTETFPCVRVVRPLCGLNEIVAGAAEVRTGTALRPFTERLAESRDRFLFQGIRVHRLRSLH
jgi:spermidine synthase